MQMIDVMKRLAELDAQNPNVIQESSQPVEECGTGMMGGMSQPHTPASINMTAASGEELSSMLKDIMTLAGRSMGGEEPVGGADGIAVVDTEPSGEIDVGSDSEVGVDDHEPSIMRSMLDKLNPDNDEDEPEDEKPVEEYDNSPDVETQGYDSMVPSGNDLHKEKNQYPAAQPGDNAMSMEESLMNEWKKFVVEGANRSVLANRVKDLLNHKDYDNAYMAATELSDEFPIKQFWQYMNAAKEAQDPSPHEKAAYNMLNVFIRKEQQQGVAEGSKHASRPGTEKRPGSADQAQKAVDRKKEVKADYEKRKDDAEKKMDANESLDILKLAGLK